MKVQTSWDLNAWQLIQDGSMADGSRARRVGAVADKWSLLLAGGITAVVWVLPAARDTALAVLNIAVTYALWNRG